MVFWGGGGGPDCRDGSEEYGTLGRWSEGGELLDVRRPLSDFE